MGKILFAVILVLLIALSQTGPLSASSSMFSSTSLCELRGPNPDFLAVKLEIVAKDLTRPVHIANAGDGSGRLFITEQPGRIRVLKAGKPLTTPFLDIRVRVTSGGEKGLLSVAFDPHYAELTYSVTMAAAGFGLYGMMTKRSLSTKYC